MRFRYWQLMSSNKTRRPTLSLRPPNAQNILIKSSPRNVTPTSNVCNGITKKTIFFSRWNWKGWSEKAWENKRDWKCGASRTGSKINWGCKECRAVRLGITMSGRLSNLLGSRFNRITFVYSLFIFWKTFRFNCFTFSPSYQPCRVDSFINSLPILKEDYANRNNKSVVASFCIHSKCQLRRLLFCLYCRISFSPFWSDFVAIACVRSLRENEKGFEVDWRGRGTGNLILISPMTPIHR